MTMSAYDLIYDNLDADGCLPVGFVLPEPEEGGLRFAPGAKDGILTYHATMTEPEGVAEQAVSLLTQQWDTPEQFIRLTELLMAHRALTIVNPVIEALSSSRDDSSRVIIDNAWRMAFDSDYVEMVKLGIAIFGLIDLDHEGAQGLRDQLMTLAVYDEFTWFVVIAMARQVHGNDWIFQIAKRVHGWGKIHAVAHLSSKTPKIRRWILCHGCDNGVVDGYLGLTCAVKGDLIEALRHDEIDEELFEGFSVIIHGLMDEGPAIGISGYDHGEEALTRFVAHASTRVPTLDQVWRLSCLVNSLAPLDIEGKDAMIQTCTEILQRESTHDVVLRVATDSGHDRYDFACDLARILHLDLSKCTASDTRFR